MTTHDQRTEPVYEIDLRDLSDDEAASVRIPDPRAGALLDMAHPDPSVRLAAVSRLTERPRSVPLAAVTARLRDPEPSVRRAAMEVLAATGDERALVLLLEAIQDPVEDLRRVAGNLLRRHRSPGLLALIRRELRIPTRAEAADTALAMLTEGRTDGGTRSGPDPFDPPPEEVPSLMELLGDPRPERRRIACERLGFKRARSAVGPLVERLEDPERGVRIKAADALAVIGDERALDALERAGTTDPDPGVALAMRRAAQALTAAR